jgi:hypothetical protein
MPGRAQRQNAAVRSVAAKTPSTLPLLLRQALWGCAAAMALAVAVLSSQSGAGTQKVAAILSSLRLASSSPPARAFDAEYAARQLAQAVHGLADDRDRLAMRLAAVERDMDDVTGSIKQQIEAAKAAGAPAVPPWPDAAPSIAMTPADIAAMVKPVAAPPPANAANPVPPATTAATLLSVEAPAAATAYGADIGAAISIKALRTRWTALRAAYPQLFAALRPVVNLRDNPRTSRAELHLVVGPFTDAEAAVQLCSSLAAMRLFCQPTMFDGRHLALR